MASKRSTEQSFTQDWNKTASWAQASGISSSSYLPVYQLDVQRLQAGEYPMSAAERHVGVLAAANPNNVPSAPTDNPQPSNVFGNARHDLAMIATGLEPTHLISGLFDTIKNTVEAVADPKREEGKDFGITAANWLQNTLLSFIPGAYDIGTVLRADPTLSGSEGFKALADHPLLSLLDVLPADAGGVIAKVGIGSKLAELAGTTTDVIAQQSITKSLVQAVANRTWGMKGEYDFAPDAAVWKQVTIGDKIQKWLGNGPLGTNKGIQELVKGYMTANQVAANLQATMITPTLDTLGNLSTDELKKFDQIMLEQTRGKNLQTLMDAPDVTERTREAIRQTFNGPIRFLTDHAIAQNDVVGIRRLDGSIGLYARVGKAADAVKRARDYLGGARDQFLKEVIPFDKQVEWINTLDSKQKAFAASLDAARDRAFKTVGTDEDRLKNVKQEYTPPGAKPNAKPKQLVFGKRKEVADKVFGPSGLVSQLVDAMRDQNYDHIEPLADTVDHNLQEWGYMSVDATSAMADPTFKAVADQVHAIQQLVKERARAEKWIDDRMQGELRLRESEKKADEARRRQERKDMEDRHKAERADLRAQKKLSRDQVKTARAIRMKALDDLYEKMKAASLERFNNASVRATKAQADALYKEYKRDEARLRGLWYESKNRENAKYDKMDLKGQLDLSKEEPALIKRQEREKKELAATHAWWKLFHGSMVNEMRNYVDAIKEFNQAVFDHPTDDYQSMELRLWQKHLFESEKNAELIDATERRLKDKVGWDESRVDALHRNPDLMKEELWLTTREIYEHPSVWEPSLVDFAKEAMDEARKSGTEELNLLIAEGYRPEWIPRATSGDELRTSAGFKVGQGTPHVDVAHERARDMTAVRHDVAIGVTKATAQAIQRDKYVEFVNQYLMPKAITGTDLRALIQSLAPEDEALRYENIDTSVGTVTDAMSSWAVKHGLKRFDAQGLFGFTPPRWQDEAVYLPKGLADALEKTVDMSNNGDRSLLDKPTQLFRYSILGLSPRYTAHILFGGTFLLALRSTPYLFKYLPAAVKGLRDGDFDPAMFRTSTQEGLDRFQSAMKEHSIAGGKNMAHLVIQEDMEKKQGILLSKASPIHYLKSMADVNFRFTRYATRLQEAMAYLDYSAKAEREGTFIDAEGHEVKMTKERAHAEGMNHVLQVFGDLRSMSPLERSIAKNILPFYGWTRHILKYVLTMPIDHPWRAMVLALIAYENSEAVPKGLPERIQFLFFLGSPDKQGNVTAIDDRFLDPLRDVANYATLGGWIQGLNPVLLAPLAMMDPQIVYGSTQLYPNLSYNDLYGIETAGAQGNAITGLEQFVPQLGAVGPLASAIAKAGNVRQLASDPNAFYKSVFNDLNIPFAQVQKVNVKQIAARDAIDRFKVAEQAAQTAFTTGDFSGLAGYKTVPYPLNADYEVTPEQLQSIYNQALAEYPGQQPANVLLPPPTPSNY